MSGRCELSGEDAGFAGRGGGKLRFALETDAPVRRSHGEDEGRRLVKAGLQAFGLSAEELAGLKKGGWTQDCAGGCDPRPHERAKRLDGQGTPFGACQPSQPLRAKCLSKTHPVVGRNPGKISSFHRLPPLSSFLFFLAGVQKFHVHSLISILPAFGAACLLQIG